MLNLYTERIKLMSVFNQMFQPVTTKPLEGDVEIGEDFDYIPYQVYGAASFGPKNYLKEENLDYCENEQGISRFDTFIKLCVQVGGAMQYQQLTPEMESAKASEQYYRERYLDQAKKNIELQHKTMPEGDVYAELEKLRKENVELKTTNKYLQSFKDKILKIAEPHIKEQPCQL
jgi:cell division protein FtsB